MPFPIGVGGDSGALERGLALVVLVEYGGGGDWSCDLEQIPQDYSWIWSSAVKWR